LLHPTRLTADGAEHSAEEIRERLKEQFKITPEQAKQTHKSGQNVFVRDVAWALAHLVMGKLIEHREEGVYLITDRGTSVLKANPAELTITELH
jgi:restriction endonuclease Mrr